MYEDRTQNYDPEIHKDRRSQEVHWVHVHPNPQKAMIFFARNLFIGVN